MIMTEEKREKRTPEKQGRIVSKHGISQASAWPKQTSSRGERRRGQIHNISASKERRLLLFTSRFSRMFEKLFISVSKQLRSWVLFGGYGRADGHAFWVLAFSRKSEKNTSWYFFIVTFDALSLTTLQILVISVSDAIFYVLGIRWFLIVIHTSSLFFFLPCSETPQ